MQTFIDICELKIKINCRIPRKNNIFDIIKIQHKNIGYSYK